MGKSKGSSSHKIVTSTGKKKTFAEDSDLEDDLDLEAALENDTLAESDSDDDDDNVPEVGGTNEAEIQRLRQLFEQHAPKESEAKMKKKKKRKARPVEEVDESDKIDASILADIDEDDLDAHKKVQEEGGGGDEDEENNEGVGKNKNKGLRILKNKRSSKKIGDLDVSILKNENPVSMMIRTGHKGSKTEDLLSTKDNDRVDYNVFSAQKKRQPAKKFKI